MATFSDARAVYGLSATGTPTSTNVSGSVQIGVNQTQLRLADADTAYSLRAVMAGSGDDFVFDLLTSDTTGTTSFVAGTAQVETVTVVAASGITLSGNATVTVTAAGMTGSPKAISVALTSTEHTTATLIATAIAAALNADASYSAMFTATSSGADVITTRNSIWTATPSIYPANDSTLNVAIANGTCTGITTAGTSANTTAGVETTGTKIYDGDGKDFEGVSIPVLSIVCGVLIQQSQGNGADLTATGFSYRIGSGDTMLVCNTNEVGFPPDFSATPVSDVPTEITITVIGKSA